MAPEIITQVPGTFSMLDYSKADLWAAGAIAYEIFGHKNPFYAAQLKNVDYTDNDLPPLGSEVPAIVRDLVSNILRRNPRKVFNNIVIKGHHGVMACI